MPSVKQRTVFAPNKGEHRDYTEAEEWGEVRYLTEGFQNKFLPDEIYERISDAMADATEDDIILIGGLSIIPSLACAHMAMKFGKINLLLKNRQGAYDKRTVHLYSENEEGAGI